MRAPPLSPRRYRLPSGSTLPYAQVTVCLVGMALKYCARGCLVRQGSALQGRGPHRAGVVDERLLPHDDDAAEGAGDWDQHAGAHIHVGLQPRPGSSLQRLVTRLRPHPAPDYIALRQGGA